MFDNIKKQINSKLTKPDIHPKSILSLPMNGLNFNFWLDGQPLVFKRIFKLINPNTFETEETAIFTYNLATPPTFKHFRGEEYQIMAQNQITGETRWFIGYIVTIEFNEMTGLHEIRFVITQIH